MSGETGPAAGRRTIDTTVAHSARVHDYWLGGKDNFAADRAAGDAVMEAYPGIVMSVRANRAFLARAVRFLAGEAGIRQFLDIGTGIPAANNTHEVAQSVAASARVVYVDYDHCKSGCAHARCWLRRRLRQVRWKEWKTTAAKRHNLRIRGIPERQARKWAGSSKGYWRVSGSKILQVSLPNSYWDRHGLKTLSQTWQRLNRTA